MIILDMITIIGKKVLFLKIIDMDERLRENRRWWDDGEGLIIRSVASPLLTSSTLFLRGDITDQDKLFKKYYYLCEDRDIYDYNLRRALTGFSNSIILKNVITYKPKRVSFKYKTHRQSDVKTNYTIKYDSEHYDITTEDINEINTSIYSDLLDAKCTRHTIYTEEIK
jgi:hypothetical protein